MQIKNPRRKKQIEKFIDKDHKVMRKYYNFIDSVIFENELEKEMRRLIEEDKDFYDSYIMVADILFLDEKEKEGMATLRNAYKRAVMRIADSQGRWPKEMKWGFLQNRHLMRIIERYGLSCWKAGDINQALDIFRRLLRMNPGDNQGARHIILAIRMGLSPNSWQKPFEVKDKGVVYGLDAGKLCDWFNKNVKKFPKDFDWLFERRDEEEKMD